MAPKNARSRTSPPVTDQHTTSQLAEISVFRKSLFTECGCELISFEYTDMKFAINWQIKVRDHGHQACEVLFGSLWDEVESLTVNQMALIMSLPPPL